MASKGTITGGFANGQYSSYFTYRCDWEVLSQSTANKTSTVQLKFVVTKKDASFYTNKASTPWTQTVNGATTSGNLNFNIGSYAANADYVVRTATVTIQHGNDGIGVANISGSLDLSGTTAGVATLSGAATLPTIATTPPTINDFSVSDASGAFTTLGVWVGGVSRPAFTCSASGNSGASISQYKWYVDGNLLETTTSGSYTSTTPIAAGSHSLSVVVVDSYGNTNSDSYNLTFASYSLPKISSATAFRCNSSGTADESGSYVSVSAAFSYSATGSNNATCRAECNGYSTTVGNGGTAIINAHVSSANAYTVLFTVTDRIGNKATVSVTLFIATSNEMQAHPDGGFSFGKDVRQGYFDVNYLADFFKPVTFHDKVYYTSGSWTPTIIAGGTGFTKSDLVATYYKLGPIVMINFLVWDMAITGGNSSVVCVSLPFRPASARNYGFVGFNGTGLNELHTSASGGNNYFIICYRQPNGYQVAVTGTDGGGAIGTFQFQMWYFTNE